LLVNNCEPSYAEVHKAYLPHKGVTLELLWQEWVIQRSGTYSYRIFNRRFRESARTGAVTLRHEYCGGEKLFTDHAGERLSCSNEAGRKPPVEIFVAMVVVSIRIFSAATNDQKEQSWFGSHTRGLGFFRGVLESIDPDNLQSAVRNADRDESLLRKASEDRGPHYGTTFIPTRVRKARRHGHSRESGAKGR
jgi:transposase